MFGLKVFPGMEVDVLKKLVIFYVLEIYRMYALLREELNEFTEKGGSFIPFADLLKLTIPL